MQQELADKSGSQGLKVNKSKMMMESDTPINVNNTHIENAESYVRLHGTETQHHIQKPRQGDSKKNHGWIDIIRQVPLNLQG